jgi:HD-GYP domain-containing protein (c-di-GMP phosphodiesterase class II)
VEAETLRLAELVGAMSLATDLGIGMPEEHVLRQCRIAVALGAAAGVADADRDAAYHVALLAWVGCTSDSHEVALRYGDDIALRSDSYRVDRAGRPALGFLLRRVGTGQPAWRRAQLAAAVVASRGTDLTTSMATHCLIASIVAERLGFPPAISGALRQVFERWDGRGAPAGLRGAALPVAVRLVQIADVAALHHRSGGTPAAVAAVRARAGGQFDPELATALADAAATVLDPLDDDLTWPAVLAAEPAPHRLLHGDAIDAALEALGDFADLKAPCFSGHARGVAALVGDAAAVRGLAPDAAAALRRAALVQDVGRLGVPTTIWSKPGPLTEAERERVRLHPYYTERVLARSPALARLGEVAGAHHERLDGSGYHRRLDGSALSPDARLLAAADVYRALREPRPHRPARDGDAAATELRGEVRAGRLDGAAVEDVLVAAGHARPVARGRSRPAGLTPRELEVLVLLAQGASARGVAERLVIAEKTARNHTERIYVKLGVSSRAELALTAMRLGLLD